MKLQIFVLVLVSLANGTYSIDKKSCGASPENQNCHCSNNDELYCENVSFQEFTKTLLSLDVADGIKIRNLILSNVNLSGSNIPRLGKLHSLKLINTNTSWSGIKTIFLEGSKLVDLEITEDFGSVALTPDVFGSKLIHLTRLKLSGAQMTHVDMKAFVDDARNLESLNLENNMIKRMPSFGTNLLANLTTLDLQRNQIETIDDLTVVELQNALPVLRNLLIKSLKCNCDTFDSKLRKWAMDRKIQDISCGSPDSLVGRDITDITKKQFCTVPDNNNGAEITMAPFSITLIVCIFVTAFSSFNKI